MVGVVHQGEPLQLPALLQRLLQLRVGHAVPGWGAIQWFQKVSDMSLELSKNRITGYLGVMDEGGGVSQIVTKGREVA